MAGLDEPDAGTVRRSPPSLAVGYLPQEHDARPGETLRGYLARRTGVAQTETTLDELAARLEEEPEVATPYGEALDRFLALGGDDLDARASAALADVGLAAKPLDEPLAELSGGEAARA